MGRVITKQASATRILKDVTETVAVAEATSPEMFADAERYLGGSLVRVDEIEEQLDINEALVVRFRAQLKAANERANDLIHRTRDEFYNLIGRALRDPILTVVFAGGGTRFSSFTARKKALALELLASGLETHRHRRVSDADVQRMTDALRAEAAAITAILASLEPALAKDRVLRSQRTATVQLAQRQLSGLKRFWIGEGLSEAEIHEVIPSRAVRRKGAAEAADSEEDGTLDEDGFEVDDDDLDADLVLVEEDEDEDEDDEAAA